MARFDSGNMVARRNMDGGSVTMQLTPDLDWIVTGSEGFPQELLDQHRQLLERTRDGLLIEVDGAPGPQFGTPQGYVFARVVQQLDLEIIQTPKTRSKPTDTEPVF